MGSVASTTLMTRAEYEAEIKKLFTDSLAQGEPPFTAFSTKTRIDVSASHSDALRLLDSVGRQQQLYRSYGQQGRVNGQPAERKFGDDHDLILHATNGKTPTHAPKRVVFGLPHNYFFSSTRAKADVNYAPNGAEGRRASPLCLHIHPVSDGGFVAVHTLMPAKFLPTGGQIRIKARGTFNVPSSPDWSVLHTYLNRFTDKKEVIHGQR
jgi:CRISPR-associated protein Cmr1